MSDYSPIPQKRLNLRQMMNRERSESESESEIKNDEPVRKLSLESLGKSDHRSHERSAKSSKNRSVYKSEERTVKKARETAVPHHMMNTIGSHSEYGSPSKRRKINIRDKSALSYNKHVMRVSKANGSFGKRERRKKNHGRIRVQSSNTTKPPINYFDIDELDQDLPELDLMMDYLEKHMPPAIELEDEKFDVEGMIIHNAKLRDKITRIVIICKETIQRASNLKKSIVTHRTMPEDSDTLKEKREELKNCQKQNVIAQKYILGLKQKIVATEADNNITSQKSHFGTGLGIHNNNIKKLTKEVLKLEAHKKKLIERLYSQWKDLTRLNPETEFNSKVEKAAAKLGEFKKENMEMQVELKGIEEQHKIVLKEYAKVSKKKNALVNKKIALKNNISQSEFDKKSFVLDQEYEVTKTRHDKLKQLMINKEIKQIDKILEKEKKCAVLEQRIVEMKEMLAESKVQAEKNSKILAQKKAMVKDTVTKTIVPPSPSKPLSPNRKGSVTFDYRDTGYE
ncbi:unnamed protein product [Moneuplotes crassus]|uniref:Uncharacterized protein n=1 Tax=Euplotes crassus TaxID=5936 RepID=A0AAD1XB39_EUPCR|nr:unnamed protein product [Moneuplotes crassus]